MTERTIDLIDIYCGKCEFAKNDLYAEPCRSCNEDYNNGIAPPFFRVKKNKPNTNFERIKAMSIEEMAEFISHFLDGYHTPNQNKKRRKEMKKWLESEIKE